MTAHADTSLKRDFSDFAIVKGSVAAMAAAYALLVVQGALATAIWSPGGFEASFAQGVIAGILLQALNPMTFFLMALPLSCVVVIGLFMLARERDHTTYLAAARAGAMTAVVIIVFILIFAVPIVLLTDGIAGFAAFAWEAVLPVLSWVVTGAVAGLAGRFGAGPPRVTLQAA